MIVPARHVQDIASLFALREDKALVLASRKDGPKQPLVLMALLLPLHGAAGPIRAAAAFSFAVILRVVWRRHGCTKHLAEEASAKYAL
jgi:hypothetical protein